MRFDIITLFPELFAPLLTSGITRRAYESGLVDVHLWNPRDHAEGHYRRVDDRSFGGGPGMVMMAEPLEQALTRLGLLEALRPRLVLGANIAQGGVVETGDADGQFLLRRAIKARDSDRRFGNDGDFCGVVVCPS